MHLLGLYACCQPIAGEAASLRRRKRQFLVRATVSVQIAACHLPGYLPEQNTVVPMSPGTLLPRE